MSAATTPSHASACGRGRQFLNLSKYPREYLRNALLMYPDLFQDLSRVKVEDLKSRASDGQLRAHHWCRLLFSS